MENDYDRLLVYPW